MQSNNALLGRFQLGIRDHLSGNPTIVLFEDNSAEE